MTKQEQEFQIKQLLAQRQDARGRRLTMASLALALGESYGSVCGVVYGHRINPPLRAKIAAFLGRPVEELFRPEPVAEVETPEGPDEVAVNG